MNIKIVVPVYNAASPLKKCIESLKMHNAFDDVVFINDGSTDVEIEQILAKLNKSNWQVLHNEVNLGFVKTANLGLKLNEDGHTILLNSDTIVTSNWMTGLKQLLTQKDIGTATPWSNNAEICSFPQTLLNNKIIEKIDELSSFLFENHKPQYPILPTAVGFCMLVTQKAKKLVGYFDEETFGHGYGEENDYSLRVTEKNLKNVLCDNVYVVHQGNQSFKDLGIKPSHTTMERLLSKHPSYQNLIEEFIKMDPLSTLRHSIIDKIRNYSKSLADSIYE